MTDDRTTRHAAPRPRRFVERWRRPSDDDVVNVRYGAVLVLLLLIFLVEAGGTATADWIVAVLILLLVVATFRITPITADVRVFGSFMTLAVFALVMRGVTDPLDGWRAFSYLALFVLLSGLGFALLIGVIRQDEVDAQTIMGAIATYVLAGLAFSWLFQAVGIWDPDQFNIDPASAANFSEFSFITLTTVGFGNQYPTGALAGRLVVFEALFAQIFLATFIARLVALYGRRREWTTAATSRPTDEEE
jgi:Ion channel